MVKKESSDEKRDWQKADARVLGQIMAAQNIIFALPDITHIAEFYAHALISVPGIISCRVCLGHISAHAGEMDSSVCAECEIFRKTAGENNTFIQANPDFVCKLADQPDMRIIAIDSYQRHFGFFVFKIENATVFDVYQPFINNLANYIAISLDNRLQGNLLQKAHDELELRVEERTAELKNANELLLQDITERRRAEEALRESEEHYHALFNLISDAVYVIEQETGRVLDVNEAACRIYGYTREEWLKMKNTDVSAEPDETRKATKELPNIIPVRYHRKKDGTVFPLEMTLNTFNLQGRKTIIVAARDITERKRAEEERIKAEGALRGSDQRLRLVMEASHIGVWDLDLVDHSAFRTLDHDIIFGYAELLPRWTYEMFLEHVLPEDRTMVDRKFAHAIETQSDWNFECRIRRNDGEVRWIWATGRHLSDTSGAVRRMAGIVMDITERKRAEDEIRKLNAELEQRVRDRTAELETKNAELERMNRLFVGRELKMIELKKKIAELEKKEEGEK